MYNWHFCTQKWLKKSNTKKAMLIFFSNPEARSIRSVWPSVASYGLRGLFVLRSVKKLELWLGLEGKKKKLVPQFHPGQLGRSQADCPSRLQSARSRPQRPVSQELWGTKELSREWSPGACWESLLRESKVEIYWDAPSREVKKKKERKNISGNSNHYIGINFIRL